MFIWITEIYRLYTQHYTFRHYKSQIISISLAKSPSNCLNIQFKHKHLHIKQSNNIYKMSVQQAKVNPKILLKLYLFQVTNQQIKIKINQLIHVYHVNQLINKRWTKHSSATEKGNVKYSITDLIKI